MRPTESVLSHIAAQRSVGLLLSGSAALESIVLIDWILSNSSEHTYDGQFLGYFIAISMTDEQSHKEPFTMTVVPLEKRKHYAVRVLE